MRIINDQDISDSVVRMASAGKKLPEPFGEIDPLEHIVNIFISDFANCRYEIGDWDRAVASYINDEKIEMISSTLMKDKLMTLGITELPFTEEELQKIERRLIYNQQIAKVFAATMGCGAKNVYERFAPKPEEVVSAGMKLGLQAGQLILHTEENKYRLVEALLICKKAMQSVGKAYPFKTEVGPDGEMFVRKKPGIPG